MLGRFSDHCEIKLEINNQPMAIWKMSKYVKIKTHTSK